jgi:TetR/AcrR family transcriptional repressor of nem operon
MTEQGRATRGRIVAAAAALIGEHGVSGTSLDDIRAATNSSKSQLYHYFGDKHGLVQAVIDHQSAVVLGAQAEALDAVRDWRDLERWVDSMVAVVEQQGARGGCPIGTLAAALADTDESFRTALNDAFESWRAAIGGASKRPARRRRRPRDADHDHAGRDPGRAAARQDEPGQRAAPCRARGCDRAAARARRSRQASPASPLGGRAPRSCRFDAAVLNSLDRRLRLP